MLSTAGSRVPEFPVYRRLPISIERGEGCTVWDAEGRAYTDLYGGHAVAALGYAHPAVCLALAEQVERLSFQTNAVANSVRDQAVLKLAEIAPMPDAQVLLLNSGAEANENALRLAFLATGKSRVTAIRGSFHGRTAASAAVTDYNESWYGFPQEPFAVDWLAREDLAGIPAAISEETAAVIFEPVQGVAGAIALSLEFAQTIARRCQAVGALLIADEVQTGVGRTGTMWAVEQLGVTPDILTTAKGLGNGFPVGAVLARGDLGRQLNVGQMGTTFGGGPMACAVICAVLDVVRQPQFLPSVAERALLLHETVAAAGAEVSGLGFLMGFRTIQPASAVREALLARGFLTGDAKDPHVVRLLPPLILSESEINEFGHAIKEVLN